MRLAIRHLWFLPAWIAVTRAAFVPVADNSFLWHIRAGDLQRQAGEVLRVDPFSFTAPGAAWRTQSWLPELMYSWLHERWSLRFAVPMIVVTAVATLVAVAVLSYRSTRSARVTGVAISATAFLAMGFLNPRPVLLSYLLLACLMLMGEHRKLRWAIPLLMWIWAASHASFVLGIGYLVLRLAAARGRSWRSPLLGSVVTVHLTAHGVAVWKVLRESFSGDEALTAIEEWRPPDFTSPTNLVFVLILFLIIWSATRGAIPSRALWVVLPFVGFGMTAARAVFPAAIALVPFALSGIAVSEAKPKGRRLDVVVGLAGIALALVFWGPDIGRLDEEAFPVALAAQIGTGPTFHDDYLGGYIIYALWPQARVYVDDRVDAYGTEQFEAYLGVRFGREDPTAEFSKFGISQAILRREDPLTLVLGSRGWVEVSAEERHVLLRAPQE